MTDDEILEVIKRRMVFELISPDTIWGNKAIKLNVSWKTDDAGLETIYESPEIDTERIYYDNNDY